MANVARSLRSIEADLEEAQERVARSARTTLTEARKCGELLLEAKEQVEHGDWGTWLSRNFTGGERTARSWMQLAKNGHSLPDSKSASNADLNVGEAVKQLAKPKKVKSTSKKKASAKGAPTPPSAQSTPDQEQGNQEEAASEGGAGAEFVDQARQQEQAKPVKSGDEVISAKHRKEASKALGVVIRFMDLAGEFDRFDSTFKAMATVIQEAGK